jgi:hypothetical protein
LGDFANAIFRNQGGDIGGQEQPQISAKAGFVEASILLHGADGPEGETAHHQ